MLTRALGALCVWPLLAIAARPLTHDDYAGWKSIQTVTLSRDGKWLAYALFPQEGDGQLVIREVATGKEHREPVGAQPPAPEANEEGETGAPRRPAIRIAFTADSSFVAASTFPSAAKPGKNGLVVVGLDGFAASRVANVKSFQMPERGGRWIAYLLEPAAKEKTDHGAELRLRNLETGAETKVPFVSEYSLARDGQLLVYAVAASTPAANGVYTLAPGGNTPLALLSGPGKYSKLTWDRAQRQLVFLSVRENQTTLHHWPRQPGAGVAVLVAPDSSPLAAKATLSFSRNGESVWFGTLPPAAPKPAATKVNVDLWHWRDPLIQPMQKARAARERDRSYSAVVHLKDRSLVQIGSAALPTVTPSDDGLWALGADERAYSTEVDHDGAYADYYFADARTGARRLMAAKLRANTAPIWSGGGRHVLFYRDRDWYTASVTQPATYNLTRGLGAAFHNEQWDSPSAPAAYGHAGFTADGLGVLLYDRYDVWLAATDGSKATRLTAGREKQIQFRVLRLDSDDDAPVRGVNLAKPLYLSATDEAMRATGVYRIGPGGGAPEKLAWEDKRALQFVTKAKEADTVVVTASTFTQFPDLEITDTNFAARKRASDANPQARDLAWGSAELISYRSADGETLRGMLIKPAGFDASKQYPLLVYIYERLTQTLHTYPVPQPGSSSINQAYYASNGYLLLLPDISYRAGMPGQSAIKCVLPAIDAVVSKGFVNERAIGIQGHSWGGYQIAYMVTQTNRFRAAAAGAPVGNMTSAYNGIRWGTGLPRQFQYEHAQSRIGGTLWTAPLKFLENSPVFMADRIETPLLMMHNDADDAVPWQQGIEMFLSLRRNGKEAYLFNYNGEKHGLRKRVNQLDWARRMQEFFDHYLKGAARPEWMERGIPYLERTPATPRPAAPAPGTEPPVTPTEGQI